MVGGGERLVCTSAIIYESSSGALSLTFDCNCEVGSVLEWFDFLYKLHEK